MPEQSELESQSARVVAELVPGVVPDAEDMPPSKLIQAGQIVAKRQDRNHRAMHADAQRGGAVIWRMRQAGMSWRAIYDAIGINQRTADRWQQLFISEGITQQPSEQLDARWRGEPDGS